MHLYCDSKRIFSLNIEQLCEPFLVNSELKVFDHHMRDLLELLVLKNGLKREICTIFYAPELFVKHRRSNLKCGSGGVGVLPIQ